MHITSREYKIAVGGPLLADLDSAWKELIDDVAGVARSAGLETNGEFDASDAKERTILFLDTPSFTLRDSGLLLRQRVKRKSGKTDYTLKCRTEDRYVAAGEDVRPAAGLEHESKFEEDVAVPFVSRFSHSTTVSLGADHPLAGENYPATLSTAGQ